jgi:hypothetical protein
LLFEPSAVGALIVVVTGNVPRTVAPSRTSTWVSRTSLGSVIDSEARSNTAVSPGESAADAVIGKVTSTARCA